jgi:hypothetical protein
VASKTSKRWRDPTNQWNNDIYRQIVYRTASGMPIIKAYNGIIPQKLIPAHIEAGRIYKKDEQIQKRDGWAHFYLDDYQFERFWNFPVRYVRYLQTFQGALSPDYSVYSDYHESVQRVNVFRNRMLGAYWQLCGIPVIPSVSWSSLETLAFCFEGIDTESVVSISTVGVMRTSTLRNMIIVGYAQMVKQLKPLSVLIYGEYPHELDSFGVTIHQREVFYNKFERKELSLLI